MRFFMIDMKVFESWGTKQMLSGLQAVCEMAFYEDLYVSGDCYCQSSGIIQSYCVL